MLDHVRTRLAPEQELEAFVQAHIDDEDLRRARTAALSADSVPLNFERTVLAAF